MSNGIITVEVQRTPSNAILNIKYIESDIEVNFKLQVNPDDLEDKLQVSDNLLTALQQFTSMLKEVKEKTLSTNFFQLNATQNEADIEKKLESIVKDYGSDAAIAVLQEFKREFVSQDMIENDDEVARFNDWMETLIRKYNTNGGKSKLL